MMKLLLLVTAVAFAHGRLPACEDYCRTTWYSSQSPPPWDPTCDCMKREASHENSKPVLIGATTFKLDDAGIYFEPAKLRQANGVTYIDQPFYIVNPVHGRQPAPPKEDNDPKTSVNNDYQSKVTRELKTKKNKNKNNSKVNNMSDNKNYGFVYKVADSGNSKSKSDTETYEKYENLNKIEESLTKCLDLYILAMARQHKNDRDVVKLWEKRKFHQLSNLSDNEIKALVQQECTEAKEFVKISLDDIIDNRPKMQDASNSDSKITKDEIAADFARIQSFEDSVRSLESEKKYENEMNKNSKYYPKAVSAIVVDRTDTTTIISDSRYTPQHTLATFGSSLDNDTLESQAHVKINGSSSSVVATEKLNMEAIPITLDVSISSYVSVNSSSTPNKNRDEKIKGKNLSSHNDMKHLKVPQWIPIQDLRIIIDKDKVDSKRVPKKTANVIYAKNRQKLDERDVPPLKVTTREFVNNTAESVVNGNEILDGDLPDIYNKTAFSSSHISKHITNNPIEVEDSATEQPDETEDGDNKNSVLTGNLYFILGNEYVPTKFIQKSDGHLHIGIDGSIICAKLILEPEHESPILSSLCDCINFSNCSSHKKT